ncbi:MAG: hypothetical protein AB1540_05275 [Bdellovibrionota bacterium]
MKLMPQKEAHKFIAILSAGFGGFLILGISLFSLLYDWGGEQFFYTRMAPVPLKQTSECSVAPSEQYSEAIPALDASDAELLSTEGDLAPAEVLSLDESITKLNTARKPSSAASHQNHTVLLKWEEVPGAQAYQVKAWQLRGADRVVIFDKNVKTTELRTNAVYPGKVFWQVAAIDGKGRVGETAGPIETRADSDPNTSSDATGKK